MLKLPTNVGEWGFVIVLSVLFGGLAFGVIYSQVQLHDMKLEQARQDTETHLHLLSDQVRQYHQRTGKFENNLTSMGVPPEALETRHATIADSLDRDGDVLTIKATLMKYGNASCVLSFKPDDGDFRTIWGD